MYSISLLDLMFDRRERDDHSLHDCLTSNLWYLGIIKRHVEQLCFQLQ